MIVTPDGDRIPRKANVCINRLTLRVGVDLDTGTVDDVELLAYCDGVDPDGNVSVMDEDGMKDLDDIAKALAIYVFEHGEPITTAKVDWS